MELNKARTEINNIDKEIVNKIGHYKRKQNLPVYDEIREKQVIESCINFLENKQYSKCIDDIYFQIMRSCKDIQNNIKE